MINTFLWSEGGMPRHRMQTKGQDSSIVENNAAVGGEHNEEAAVNTHVYSALPHSETGARVQVRPLVPPAKALVIKAFCEVWQLTVIGLGLLQARACRVPVRELLLGVTKVITNEEALCIFSLAGTHHTAIQRGDWGKPVESEWKNAWLIHWLIKFVWIMLTLLVFLFRGDKKSMHDVTLSVW